MRWGERLLHMQPVQLEGKDSELRNYATGFLQGGVQGRLQNSGGQLPREPASTGRLILQKSWMAPEPVQFAGNKLSSSMQHVFFLLELITPQPWGNFWQLRQLKKDDLAKHDDSFYQRISLGLDRNVSLIQYYEESRRNYTLGVKAAQEVGFTIVPCNFADLVKDMCACVRPALATLTEKSSGCEERTIHDENADKEITLETFLSEENVAKIRASLKGTAYEWMLNLKATDWPKDVPPPIPVPTWRQHHSLN
mmetsp:Transcript_9458/g.11451  ORF Transcript_9458/g.11451 Transcript_9458/m.11451 type:complete len:252 (+) Transcript_9458:116-871(+)